MEKAKKTSKDASEVKEKKKKEKKSKEISALEGEVMDASTVEEKKSTKQKKEVNKEAKPDKKKKEKKSKQITNPDELVTGKDFKAPKRKRDSKDDSSKSKKKSKKTALAAGTLPEELEIDISAPNPPSKKALRLQKKGKPVPKLPSTSLPPTTLVAAADTDTTHPDRQKLVKEIPRAEWSVWIGNLSYKSDVKGLRGWLVRGDKRVTDKDITRINLPLNADAQSKGYLLFSAHSQPFLADVGLRMWIY